MEHRLLEPGSVFAGRYRIERFLAEGGFGAVYVAEQTATEAHVAIKVLWPQVLQSEDAVEKFRQEARIAGRVNSEHIVRVVDAGFDDNTRMPFLAMELLEGEDLQRVLERGGPLTAEQVVTYLRQVASALDKAHGYTDRSGTLRPIVHRDLKPENLFLTFRETGEPLVKVLDFGIAKVLSGTSNMSREVKGTPLFMAFEQATGAAITPQTDVWALGLIAFYLLTGHSYWRTTRNEDGSLMQLFGEVMHMPLDPPTQRLAELGVAAPWPSSFDAWFFGCVNRNAAQRFASASAAIVALGEVLGVTVAASHPNPSIPGVDSGAWSSPAPLVVPPTPVAAARSAEAGPTLQSAAPPHGSTAQGMAISGSSQPVVPKSSSRGMLWVALGAVVLLGAGGAAALMARSSGQPDPAASRAAPEPSAEIASASPPPSAAPPPSAEIAPAASSAAPEASAPAASASVATAPKPTAKSPPSTTSTAKPPTTGAATSSKPKPKAGGQNGLYDDR